MLLDSRMYHRREAQFRMEYSMRTFFQLTEAPGLNLPASDRKFSEALARSEILVGEAYLGFD